MVRNGDQRSEFSGQRKAVGYWLRCNRADLVWSSVVLVAVLLPLAALTLDVPRYFVLRSRLQLAVDAAAEATAQCVDIRQFQNTGETRIEPWCVLANAEGVFARTVEFLHRKGYSTRLDELRWNDASGSVTVRASGSMPIFFALTPRLTVQVAAQSKYRVIVK